MERHVIFLLQRLDMIISPCWRTTKMRPTSISSKQLHFKRVRIGFLDGEARNEDTNKQRSRGERACSSAGRLRSTTRQKVCGPLYCEFEDGFLLLVGDVKEKA